MVSNITTDDVIRLRFAYRPLTELTLSYRVLRSPWQHGLYWRWKDEAHRAIHDLELPYMDALIIEQGYKAKGCGPVPSGYVPDFLTPTPHAPITNIEIDLEHLAATPADLVQEGIWQLMEFVDDHPAYEHFLAHPHEALQILIAEMRLYWQRALAHHWRRMQSVLENDILHYSRLLTLQGTDALFSELDEALLYANGVLSVHYSSKNHPTKPTKTRDLLSFSEDNRLLHLVPLIFAANTVYHQVNAPWEPMILYTPRGVGLWNYETPAADAALEITLGTGKARLLQALASPANTSELAHSLSLTAGAVSQQLKRLHQAGLVESHRSGKRVYYRLTQRGEQLLLLFE